MPRFLTTLSMCSLISACLSAGADEPAVQPGFDVSVAAQVDGAKPASGNLFLGATLFVDPESKPAVTARAWRATRPADAAQMDKIAKNPSADWIEGRKSVDWVRARVTQIKAAGALPVFVFYNVPGRDCGNHSAGGVAANEYDRWISTMADAIGNERAVIVLEPDAIALTECLSKEKLDERFAMLRRAVSFLSRRGFAVYLDAGHSNWHSADEMARRLTSAGIAEARGFSLNVSNFNATDREVAYGREVSARVGKKPFIVDTSRNGAGSDGNWCNPAGRALGTPPTAKTGQAEVDAFFWIKPPGESDGQCNGGLAAGQWMPEYALGLAQRARF